MVPLDDSQVTMAGIDRSNRTSAEGGQFRYHKFRPLVVALVLNWNGRTILYGGKSVLELCLSSLSSIPYMNLQIVLVDAQSQDDSVEFTSREFKSVSVTVVPNEGTAPSFNAAVRFAFDKYPNLGYLLVLNNDLIFDSTFLDKMVDAAESEEGVGIVGCRLLYPNGVIQHCGSHDSISGEPSMIRYQTRSGRVDSVVGAVLLVRANVIKKMGLFDENYAPFGHDDADFCKRASIEGYATYLVSDTKVVHLESYSLQNNSVSGWSKEEIEFSLLRGHYLYCLRWHKSRLILFFANRFLRNTAGLIFKSTPNLGLRTRSELAMASKYLETEIRALIGAVSLLPQDAIPRLDSRPD